MKNNALAVSTQTEPLELVYSKNVKIKNLDDPKEVINLLNYLNVLLNIKKDNQLNELEESVLNGVIITQFNTWTIDEIKHAFRMAVSGKLNIELFNKLDSLVFGRVLKAYNEHKSIKIKNYNSTKKPALSVIDTNKLNEQALKGFIKEYKNQYNKSETPIINTPAERVFNYYLNNKTIYLSPGEKAFYLEKAENMIKQHKREQRTKKKQFRLNTDPKAILKQYARCIALHDKFNNI